MSSESWRFIFLICYVVFYGCLGIGSIAFMRWRRKTKWPFKESDKLLRGPGEGLRRQIIKIDESFAMEFLATIAGAAFVWPLLAWLTKIAGLTRWPAFFIIVAGLIAVALISVWRITRLWKERSNLFLGWFGERLTAEKLQPLQLQGYRVFHDVPGEPGKEGFNIDHVVVGPTGVVAVEVKTRRKGNARPGYKDHEVAFDGSQLDWPWGYDRHGIQQALNEADWLRKWLFKCTAIKIHVRAVLTLPGWYVRESPSPAIRVVNPSFLPDAIRGRGESVLTTQQVDLISRQLDQRCRNVED